MHVRLSFASGNCEACRPALPEPDDSVPPQSSHDAARAGRLRPSIVGGVPLDPDPVDRDAIRAILEGEPQ